MTFRSLFALVALCVSANAQTQAIEVNVSGKSGPWVASPSFNEGLRYGTSKNDADPPTVVTHGFDFKPGATFTITHVRGATRTDGGSAAVNAGGYTTRGATNLSNDNGGFPSRYMCAKPANTQEACAKDDYKQDVYLNQLVGAFADDTGKVLGRPFAIGISTTKTVPVANVTRLLLGVNDSQYGDNGNDPSTGLTVSITGPMVPLVGPTIANIDPPSLPAGSTQQTITINGTNFVTGSAVQVQGMPVPTVFVSAVQLKATLNQSQLAEVSSLPVSVLNPNNTSAISSLAVAAPALTSLAPASVIAGTVGFDLVVNGSNFIPTAKVMWGTTELTTNPAGAPNRLVATVPADLIASPKDPIVISVRNTPTVISNTLGLPITKPATPSISGLQPASAVLGGPTFPLTILGDNFANNAAPKWNGSSLPVSSIAPKQIIATVSASLLTKSGPALVTVEVPAAGESPAKEFAVDPPLIETVSPSSATAGGTGLTLEVTGTSFLSTSTVLWKGVPVPTVFASSSSGRTTLKATIDSTLIATAGSAGITVQNAAGTNASGPFTFPILPPAPTITNLAPSPVAAGGPTFPLTISGTNFVTGTVASWNDSPLPTTVVDSTRITAIVNGTLIAKAGPVSIKVKVPGALAQAEYGLSVENPAISSLLPNSATATRTGFQVTVNGSYFLPTSTVYWGATPVQTTAAQPNSVSGFVTQLTASIPSNLTANPNSFTITVKNTPGDAVSAGADFTVVAPNAAVAAALSPRSTVAGGPTFTLTISGSDFTNGAVAQWGTISLPTTFVSSTQLTAVVDSTLIAAKGTANVAVQVPGAPLSQPAGFTINGPEVGSLTPPSVNATGAQFQLTVLGSNFLPSSTVLWNGAPLQTVAAGFDPSTPVTQLTATVPANLIASVGKSKVTVRNTPGTTISDEMEFVIAEPNAATVSSLTPSSTPAGGPGLTLTIYGSNFTNTSVTQWNAVSLPTSFVSSTQLTAIVDASLIGSAGIANITVQVPGAAISQQAKFTVNAPAIASLTPSTATATGPPFQLTVSGSNLLSTSTVLWNGTPVPTTAAAPSGGTGPVTQLTATVPPNLTAMAGSAFVSVQNTPGTAVSNAVMLPIAAPNAAGVSGISPPSGVAGGPTFTLTITGSNFASNAVALWNNTPLPTTFVSANQLTAVVDASQLLTPGTANIGVQIPGAPASTIAKFTVNGPTILSLTPNSVNAGGAGFQLTVLGANLLPSSTVFWNGSAVPTVALPPSSPTGPVTQLTATISSAMIAASSKATVTVQNTPGTATSAPATFTISPPNVPTISALAPQAAIAGSPTFSLTVTGSNFLNSAVVQWNGVALPTTVSSATQLSALVDSGLIANSGIASITVQIPEIQPSAAARLTINGPVTGSVAPNSIVVGGPALQLTVTGSNFLSSSTVLWNGNPIATVAAPPNPATSGITQLTASVPAALIATEGIANIAVQNTPGTATSPPVSVAIGPFTLAITVTSLPDAVLGAPYMQTLPAAGGMAPYTWSISGGALPGGLAIDPTGKLTGTPTALGTSSFVATVSDSTGRSISKAISVKVVLPLSITSGSPMVSGLTGVPYSQVLAGTGGTPPYTWTLIGTLPGLAVDTVSGLLSGVPTAAGNFTFNAVLTDNDQLSASKTLSMTILPQAPANLLGGVPINPQPGQQPSLTMTLANPYPADITGMLTLTFSPDGTADDPVVQFSTGGRVANFTVPAGTTQALFGRQPNVLMSTGTTAGTITLASTMTSGGMNIMPAGQAIQTIMLRRLPPVISSAGLEKVTNGFTATMSGYSNTRDIRQAILTFVPAAGSSLKTSTLTVPLAGLFSTWYQSAASTAFGTQFSLSIPFTVTGNINGIASVSMVLTNNEGESQPVAVSF